MSSGHTHNRNGRGNQRRKHGPPRQQPQNDQSQNGQSQNGQPRNSQTPSPRGERTAQARSTTALPGVPAAPFQAPDDPSPSGDGEFVIVERVTYESAEVAPERTAQALPRPAQQRNTHPPGKRGAFLVSSERQNEADTGGRSNGHGGQHGMQSSSIPRGNGGAPHMQPAPAEPFVSAEPPAPASPPRNRRADQDTPPPNTYGMQYGGADDTDDTDDDYVAQERRPARDVRGDIGGLIDSLHALFAQNRSVASQGNTARCGICYLYFSVAELEYREVEGYYVCADCKRTLGSTQLMMLRRQQKG
ncbi:MAG TPA: hypothetical protein VF510_03530 [Ktedonobacterales bacterium]